MSRIPMPTFAAILLVPGLCAAQNYDELPGGGWTRKVDRNYDYFLCPNSSYVPLRVQYAYDVNDIPVPAARFTELAWHRNNYFSNAMPAGSITTTITLAIGPNSPAAISSTFATNLAKQVTKVFQGTVNWPNVPKGNGPAPWTHVVKLKAPYVYVKSLGKSLIVELITTATTYGRSTYTIDAAGKDYGTRTSNPRAQSSCRFSNGRYNNSLSYTTAGLTNAGGPWYVRYGGILPNALGLVTLSAFGVDNKGNWPLPINLAPLGAPGCTWNVGLETGLWIPVRANASGSAALPTLQIPPGLAGVSFYDHGFFIDPKANKLGIVVTWSSKWTIASGKAPSASLVYRIRNTGNAPTGFVRRDFGTHLRITR